MIVNKTENVVLTVRSDILAKIVLLDEITANQIAAGEVVERPVSVVKELIENSLDAGANKITVELIQGGIDSIKVVDNGFGMSEEDAALCFQRHATSKIRLAEDLSNILTLGFRGEALPSIASVARVRLITRNKENLAGCVINVEAGKVTEKSSIGCPIGTTVEVKDLFFNTPARRKFIKSVNAETSQVSELMSRIALARPDVRLELRSGNKVLFLSPGTGLLKDTAGVVLGVDNAKSMLEVDYQGELLTITGLISKPVLTRASRQYQSFFINKRYIKSNLLSSGLQQAYQTLVPSGRFPIAILHITIDPTQVDVNVHPTKMEVRFAREQEVQQELLEALTKPLNRPAAITGIWEILPSKQATAVTQDDAFQVQPPKEQTLHPAGLKNSLPAPTKQIHSKGSLDLPLTIGEKKPADQIINSEVERPQTPVKNQPPENTLNLFLEHNQKYETDNLFQSLVPAGQVPPTYVLAYGANGLFIIDQHAAHERVLYEKYLRLLDEDSQSQILLHPITIEISHHEAQILIKNIVEFNEIGYILEHFGGDTFLLRGVPSHAQNEPEKIFLDLIARLQDNPIGKLEKSIVIDHLAAALACRDAVKAGKHMGYSETKALLEGLGQCNKPYTCPHGRPTLIQISHEEMKKRFKR